MGALPGWVKGDADLIKVGKVHDDPFIRPILDRLREFDDLRDRNVKNRDLKSVMAECFWVHFGKAISDSGISKMFFESGSTINYVFAKLKLDGIQDNNAETRIVVSEDFRRRLVASTNGILTYFDNLFFPDQYEFGVTLWPPGRPEGTYGATFGDRNIVENDPINRDDWQYIKDRREEVDQMDMLLVTSSGLNLSDDSFPLGLHVGSFINKVFKIALLTSRAPKIYFMDESKIDDRINKDHCRFVANYKDHDTNRQAQWSTVVCQTPIAFCIGTHRESSIEDLKAKFSDNMQFNNSFVISHHRESPIKVLFVYNDRFAEFAKKKEFFA
jgi:hypothetical protein